MLRRSLSILSWSAVSQVAERRLRGDRRPPRSAADQRPRKLSEIGRVGSTQLGAMTQ